MNLKVKMKKAGVYIAVLAVLAGGCGREDKDSLQYEDALAIEEKENSDQQEALQELCEDSEHLAEGYREIYENGKKYQTMNTLEGKQQILNYLGNKGYAAVDAENQINMVNSDQVEDFCAKAKKRQDAEATIFSVIDEGAFIRYTMHTREGNIDVVVSSLKWEGDSPKAEYVQSFQAYTWNYTENGYFIIERYLPEGYDGAIGQTGFRVKPLDETCRELNQKYVMPIGYERNNLLITDWSEDDFADLNFGDLYDRMYEMKYGESLPYDVELDGAKYEIPKEDFESVLKTYLKIDSSVVEKKAGYHTDSQTYPYYARGMEEYEMPYEPYPEVISYEEQADGTIKLMIQGVWIMENSDRVISSELVIRPLDNGSFQYVSNHVTDRNRELQERWYVPRKTLKWPMQLHRPL